LVGGWDGTGGVAAEDSVAEARDEGIAELAQGAGDTDQKVAETGPAVPRIAEDIQRTDDGIGAAVETLVRAEGVGDEDDAFGRAGGGGHGDELLGEAALERGEAKLVTVIVAEDEPDDSVAEGADAVIKKNRAAFDLGSFRFRHRSVTKWTLILCRCRLTLLFPVRCNFVPNNFFPEAWILRFGHSVLWGAILRL
jgi:hypothetical protein